MERRLLCVERRATSGFRQDAGVSSATGTFELSPRIGGPVNTRFILLIGAVAALLASCASAPPRSPQDASRLNGVSCQFLGLESVEGASDSDSDSVALLAVYRFAGPGAAASKRDRKSV